MKLVNSSTIFYSTCIVIFTTVLIVYFSGVGHRRSFFHNTLLSTTILSVAFFLLITIGLYNGWKLKDTLGDFRKRMKLGKPPEPSGIDTAGLDLPIEGGLPGILLGLLVWLIVALFGALLLWLTGGMIWAMIMLLAGLLYWIVFRAFRLIFKQSPKCHGNFFRSAATALGFTILYNFWIYLIILMSDYYK